MQQERIILGIDPGTIVTGYGLVLQKGTQPADLITLGALQLGSTTDQGVKLKKLFDLITTLIQVHSPDVLAIEAPFFGKNVQSMLKLGRAQGVVMAACLAHDMQIFEYSPKKIKQSITGNGNASKEQVAAMLQMLLRFEESPKFLDATDGLAAAVCHSLQHTPAKNNLDNASYSGWSAFVKNNPKRLK